MCLDIGYDIEFRYRRVIFNIKAPRNENWPISGTCGPPNIEESLISNVFSSISDCLNIEDSSILAFKTYTNIELLSFNIEALIDSPGPRSCRIAGSDCRMHFSTGHRLQCIYFIARKWLLSLTRLFRRRVAGRRRRNGRRRRRRPGASSSGRSA